MVRSYELRSLGHLESQYAIVAPDLVYNSCSWNDLMVVIFVTSLRFRSCM